MFARLSLPLGLIAGLLLPPLTAAAQQSLGFERPLLETPPSPSAASQTPTPTASPRESDLTPSLPAGDRTACEEGSATAKIAALLEIKNINNVTTNIAPPPNNQGRTGFPDNKTKDVEFKEQRVHSFVYANDGYRSYLEPAAFCHRPTYFEENQLERYGNRLPAQPLVSGAKFGFNLVALPYKMVVEPPRHCHYPVHPFEAGVAAPHYFEVYPFDRRAAAVEAAAIAGLILVIP